ncbi:tRNA (guanine(37)-N1)-methyltransferase [Venustampulla echinocandica]|uniref:tRNA (guanine(37)-N1)-methyltransferase n=1 Tax=Venustampulla echinocandica TaxID=2656787 RepID=A0A370TSK7_9HELO|nr:tRNA (guanine(37)-N1)-methyltransferase [Venustampulla echinocandica]RDL38468.1 tRNA (guanine(37)-N1)-methyltransferase [Venustampulla echinocandica]
MTDEKPISPSSVMSLLRPPIVRSAAATLDRSLFSKTVPITAARITNLKNISRVRTGLEKSKELLRLDRLINVRPDQDPTLASKGVKCLLLKPEVIVEDQNTWSSFLQEAVKNEEASVVPYNLTVNYDYWTYLDIMTALLPEDALGEVPVGFSIVGHVAHLNLRDEYLPYKNVIAEVLIDKNPTIRTVINKTDDVGNQSEYRTFGYEVLAGPDEMNVEVNEGSCLFRFDYSKVYWNSRLQTEHKRLVDMFNPGEVVCDVMAGVGPFAIPAGKKGVFVWANDLNPASYESMKDAITRNKVTNFVRPFCEDGHTFIQHAADDLISLAATKQNTISFPPKPLSRNASPPKSPRPPKIITIPQTINHFVMNLPAIAIDFVGSFNGLYEGHETLFEPHTPTKLPIVHVHCFSTKSDNNVRETIEICERISRVLGYEIKPEDDDVTVYEVRDVAPKKRMFCASFRLPPKVAFGERKRVSG